MLLGKETFNPNCWLHKLPTSSVQIDARKKFDCVSETKRRPSSGFRRRCWLPGYRFLTPALTRASGKLPQLNLTATHTHDTPVLGLTWVLIIRTSETTSCRRSLEEEACRSLLLIRNPDTQGESEEYGTSESWI